MKLVDNARYLTLIRDAIGSALVPELQTPATRATAALVQAVIDELIKRESRADAILEALIGPGTALAQRMRDLLARAGSPVTVPAATDGDRWHRHAALTAQIARLSEALSGLRTMAPPPDVAKEAAVLLHAAAEWEMTFYRRQREPLPAAPARAPESGDKDGRISREQLEAFVRTQHPDGDRVAITDFQAIPGGYGKQTSRFALREASGRECELIVRKNDRHPMVLRGAFRIDHEFDLVRAVSATGYPAPTPLWLGLDVPGVDAAFYVMERLPGRVPGSFLGGPEGGVVAEALLLDMARRLAHLHAIPVETFSDVIRRHDDPLLLAPGADGTVSACYRRTIDALMRYAAEVPHLPSPYLHYLHDWLLRHLPDDDRRPVLVHGDFNIHNLLAADDRVTGVLDWECAMFGAPEQDLAYIQPHVARFIAWDRFMAAYHAAGGREADPARMRFYQAFSMLRLHVGMNHGLLNLQTGTNQDIRYTVIELAFGPQLMEMGMASTQAG